MLTNERMFLQDPCGSLFNTELVFTAMSTNCKGRSDGSEPESCNDEEKRSNDCMARPFRSAQTGLARLLCRQLIDPKKLIVFLHSFH